MRVALLEDDDEKYERVRDVLEKKGVERHGIVRVKTVSEFVPLISQPLDLVVIDLRMPGVEGGPSRDVGKDVLAMLDSAGLQKIPVIAITAFYAEAETEKLHYSRRGCIVFDYHDEESWSQALDVFIAQSRERGRYQFAIFTALRKERDAYASVPDLNFQSVTRNGFNCWEVSIGGLHGVVVLLPSMGMVNATAVAAKFLEHYAPSVVAMSGICAGVGNDGHLGRLLVAERCWEYQSGKWLDDAFEAEPYQVNIAEPTRLIVSKMLERPKLAKHLEGGYDGFRPPELHDPLLAVFTSGSAVIASEKRLTSVQSQHRRVAGLDMEIYGLMRAVELASLQCHAFAAKVVVDRADAKKDDKYQAYGSYVSANFVIEAVKEILNN